MERRRLNLKHAGKSLSEQTLNILDRIEEVDRQISREIQARLKECHPEVVFAILSGQDRGLVHPKRSRAGRLERLRLLPEAFRAAAFAPEAPRREGSRVARDDVVDALACLVGAFRVGQGIAIHLPSDRLERDLRGLVMEIVA